MEIWKNLGKFGKNPETGKISGEENNHIICEKLTIHSVKKSEDLMKIRKNLEKIRKSEKFPEKKIII